MMVRTVFTKQNRHKQLGRVIIHGGCENLVTSLGTFMTPQEAGYKSIFARNLFTPAAA